VYYATGGRALGLAPVANFTADYKTGGAPLHVNYLDLSSNEPTLWLWTFQGGTPSSSTLQNPEVAYNSTGTYRVTLKATNSTGNNTITKEGYIVVSDATGINNPENKPALFYPNPVIDMLTIVYDKNFSVKIYNLQGELLLTGENKPQLDLSIMKPGIYIMELETETGITKHKLLKQ
jgi:PKD repeat protein